LLHAESADALSWPLLLGALVFADELERELELCDAVLAAARRSSVPSFAAIVDACRAAGLFGQGRVAEAQAVAESALATRAAAHRHAPIALAVLTGCHIERARTEQAETLLAMLERQSSRDSIRHPVMLELRARLRLAQHRAQEALDDALLAGRELRSMFAKATPGAVPWRSTAAFAYLRLGEARKARKLAEEELHDARRIGLTGTAIRDLRVLGLATGGTQGLELLTEAVRMGDTNPSRMEHIRALVDLGAALRRANRRSDARAPLRRGLELSHKHGAEVLAGRAHVELIASGARPRGAAFSGVEALTPSQRRVAGLAAQGLTTRQIAETLFVTPKTVEFHLRAVYQKLDVSSRTELTSALAAA
jgi:DNA-binding CsgD family transcriptional regulator